MGSLCFPKQPFSPSLNTMQQWGYQVHAMVSSESIPWLWIIFHSARLFKLRNKATHYSLLQFLVDYQLSILWQTHQQETPIFFWLLDLSHMSDFLRHPPNLPTIANCKYVCHTWRRSVPLLLSKAILSSRYQFHVAPSPNFANLITMRLADTYAVISYSLFSNSPLSVPSIYCQLHSFLPHRHP